MTVTTLTGHRRVPAFGLAGGEPGALGRHWIEHPDGRVTPMDGSLAAMRLIPKCELHVFYDCGHWAMIERKDEFESTVLAFLARDHQQ